MCAGTGTYVGGGINPVSESCVQCGGDGKQTLGNVVLDPSIDDVMDKLEDILEKVNEIKALVE